MLTSIELISFKLLVVTVLHPKFVIDYVIFERLYLAVTTSSFNRSLFLFTQFSNKRKAQGVYFSLQTRYDLVLAMHITPRLLF